MVDKQELPHHALPDGQLSRGQAQSRKRRLVVSGLHVVILLMLWKGFMANFVSSSFKSWILPVEYDVASICPQFSALEPSPDPGLDANLELLESLKWRNESAARLSGAVQIETQSFDDLGQVGEDDRLLKMFKFEDYLQITFPLIHEKLEKKNINTHGLLFKWQGTDPSLKPIVIMAHYDTVPVLPDTLDRWTYEPWSGTYDGTYVWGRGAHDCKTLLIAEMEAVTLLLSAEYIPKRTIYLSFGFDEEIGGSRGARHIAQYLETEHGLDSIELIIDEGGAPVTEMYGKEFVLPATGEKGSISVNITLSTTGGHSSVPPPHTGIGIISQIVTTLESNPFESNLTTNNPYFSILQCAAAHSKGMPYSLRSKIFRSAYDEELRQQIAKLTEVTEGNKMAYTTSQAVDIIKGGVKVNALPEFVFTVVNHRIRPGSSGQDVKDHYITVLTPIAERFNLDLNAFGKWYNYSTAEVNGGQLRFLAPSVLEPAPVSPTDPSNPVWRKMVGTLRHIYDGPGTPAIIAPSVMIANTDTKHYWRLTRNIYRFGPSRVGAQGGTHTVDEFESIDNHIESTRFFHQLIRNFN